MTDNDDDAKLYAAARSFVRGYKGKALTAAIVADGMIASQFSFLPKRARDECRPQLREIAAEVLRELFDPLAVEEERLNALPPPETEAEFDERIAAYERLAQANVTHAKALEAEMRQKFGDDVANVEPIR